MDSNLVMFSVSEIKIMTARHMLDEAGIESFVLNKKDSAHAGIIGDIELYVKEGHAELARKVLINAEIIEGEEE